MRQQSQLLVAQGCTHFAADKPAAGTIGLNVLHLDQAAQAGATLATRQLDDESSAYLWGVIKDQASPGQFLGTLDRGAGSPPTPAVQSHFP